jgi:uncharacterized protein (DUF302 family)
MQMARTMANGIVNEPSSHSVDQTVERLKSLLQASGAVLFGLVDHSGEAEKVGLKMKPTKLLIFGNPKAGTPLMVASPSTAIDLPLKMLVWEDAANEVWISYNSAEYLLKRHGFPEDLLPNISVVRKLASEGAR